MARKGKGKTPRRQQLGKRPWAIDDSQSLTGPLFNPRLERALKANAEKPKKQPSLIILSSSNQETQLHTLQTDELCDESPTQKECLQNEVPENTNDKFTALNDNLEKVIVAVDAPKDKQDRAMAKAKGLVRKLFAPQEANEDNKFVPGLGPILCTPPAAPFWAPNWLTSMFGSKNVMHLNYVEAVVANYIFRPTKKADPTMDEEIVKL